MRTLDPGQVRALLDAVADDRLEALYVLAVTTGMRQGELLALRWRDVDLATGRLRVTGTLYSPRGGTQPSASRRHRPVATPAAAFRGRCERALRRHAARHQPNASPKLSGTTRSIVFTNEFGRPVDVQQPSPGPSRTSCRKPDFPGSLPRPRHTAATLLLAGGVAHPKIASEMLGHASITFTLDVYSHVTETMQREAARTMDAILGESDPNRVGVNVGVKHQTRHQVDTRITSDSNSKRGGRARIRTWDRGVMSPLL